MTPETLMHMPLASSYLCQDCSAVGNCSTQCPACASEHLMNLQRVIDRAPNHGADRGTDHGTSEVRVGTELTYDELKMEYLALMVALGIAAKESRAKDKRGRYDAWVDEARDRVFSPWLRRMKETA
jgi:hypothetical protein